MAEEGEDGDLFSGPKELEAYHHSVEVKRAIQTRLGHRGGARWSLPPEAIGETAPLPTRVSIDCFFTTSDL